MCLGGRNIWRTTNIVEESWRSSSRNASSIFLPLETQTLWSKDLAILVWYQTAVRSGSASDSATMLRTNATKLEVNTNGNAGAVKQRSSVFTNCHRKESSSCGFFHTSPSQGYVQENSGSSQDSVARRHMLRDSSSWTLLLLF